MAKRHLNPGAQLIGVTADRRKTVASFVKARTAFGMAPGDTYAHSFDELKAFYVCEEEPIIHGDGAAEKYPAATISDRPVPGAFRVRDANFARIMQPLLSLLDAPNRARVVDLYRGLTLGRDLGLALAVARLVASDRGHHSLDWCAFALRVRPNRRAVFITLLAETGVGRSEFTRNAGKFLLELDALTTRANYPAWLYSACTAIEQGIDTGYLLAGFQIASVHSPWFAFGKLRNCTDYEASAVVAVVCYLRHSRGFYARLPITLWEACGELPGLSQLIALVEWKRLRPRHARKLSHMMYALMYDDAPREKMLAKWQIFRRQFASILAVIYATPLAYKNKAIDFFEEYYWRFDDLRLLEKYHADFCNLVTRICRDRFSKEDILATFWCTLIECAPLADSRALLRLERLCRSKNSAWLVVRGIRAMRKLTPGLARELALGGNERLLEIARLLGTMGRKQRYDVLISFSDSRVLEVAATPENFPAVIQQIDAMRGASVQNPVPRRLRAYFKAELILTGKSLAGQLARLNKNLVHFRLHILEHAIRESVRNHYEFAKVHSDDHALYLTNIIRENRKELRQYLSAYASGDTGYTMRHSATQRWIAKVPGVNLAEWQRGFEMVVDDAAVGEIRIAVEHQPLEKLKLGTYVGSCLGLGGSYSYSAAAAVLDFNKQVVYARDRRGRVVARQLLAVSDEGRLVPFCVYPVGATAAMQAHFAEFDRRFAAALGIACHDVDRDGEYTIANIISREWWDDGAWDMQAAE